MFFKTQNAVLLLLLFQAVASAEPLPGFLGIASKKLDTGAECVRVEQLYPGGPGELAGILPGDIILGIDGKNFDCTHLARGTRLMPEVKDGDRVRMTILRGPETLELTVVATQAPASLGPSQAEVDKKSAAHAVVDKIIATGQIFTVVWPKEGGFRVEGQMTAAEAELLRWYFEELGVEKILRQEAQGMPQRQYQIRFDKLKNRYNFEPVDRSIESSQQGGR